MQLTTKGTYRLTAATTLKHQEEGHVGPNAIKLLDALSHNLVGGLGGSYCAGRVRVRRHCVKPQRAGERRLAGDCGNLRLSHRLSILQQVYRQQSSAAG